MTISAEELDQRDQELREAGARTPALTTLVSKGTQGQPVFDHSREKTGDYVETLKARSIDLAPYSVTGQRALVAPVSDLEGEHSFAFSGIALISRR